MGNLLFSVKSVKYGTPTGTNTMPASGSMTPLPDTVKGSVSIDETEATLQEFYVDQKPDPIKILSTAKGKLTAAMQFYDMNIANMAALKGGTAATSGGFDVYTPALGFTQVEKALSIELDSGHIVNIFNSSCISRITGGGGRDKMFCLELKASPQLTADLAGSYEIRKANT